MIYVDSSAFAKRHLPAEVDRERCLVAMESDRHWITSSITVVEARRAIVRALPWSDAVLAQNDLDEDLRFASLVHASEDILTIAAEIATDIRVRSLDAIHLATALRAKDDVRVLTFDRRMREGAQQLDLPLLEI
jgi:predicted nucleic acid-binding protein